jgi:glycosyltransferase involved in cell wall biosynthesis
MSSHNKITVITRFNPKQVGYLDFQYRIAALEKADMLDVVISNVPRAKQELQISDEQFVLISGGTGSLIAQWRYYFKVRSYCIAQDKQRVILLHSSLAPLASMLKKCKTFLYWNEHPSHFVGGGNAQSGFISRWKQRYLLKKYYMGARDADMVMPIGEQHLEDLLNADCESGRLRMVYMGVNDTFRAVNDKKEAGGNLRLIYTGSVKKDRGRDIMLEAVSILKNQDKYAELTIVGAADDEKSLCEKICLDLDISDRVKIVGRVPGTEIHHYVQQADIGICIWADKPYWRFNPPTKLFEYLVAGLPVLANNMVTHTEYIKDGVNGLVCQYDANSMANAIARCTGDRVLLSKMMGHVKNNSDQFLWSNIEPEFISLISS